MLEFSDVGDAQRTYLQDETSGARAPQRRQNSIRSSNGAEALDTQGGIGGHRRGADHHDPCPDRRRTQYGEFPHGIRNGASCREPPRASVDEVREPDKAKEISF